ncbi:MAG: amidase, partial [Clostridiales bacterium]|nr:amidase [Clostridiales bacterium]
MDYKKLGIDQLHIAMENGEITSKALVIEFMKRIADIDGCEGGFNSVAEINPEAIFIAEAMDRERTEGKTRGFMHGIPVMIKDNINTADKMPTTAGSLALKHNYAPYDAGVVANLRKAGAVILAKTNLTEFANFMANDIPNGYSSRGGQVLCPYDKQADASGSSTGSAVAVAAGLTSVSIGTETSGSILSPSLTNGIVGMKPTKGLVPSEGIIPISNTLDTAGPMGRCVKDVAILLEAMIGYKKNYIKGLRSSSLEGLRIGINRANMNIMEEERIVALESLLKKLKNAGAIIIDDFNMPFHKELKDIIEYEF